MTDQLEEQMDGLVEKYTELLLGEANPELKRKVESWVLYTYISKSMPALVKHWNEQYPEGKENIKNAILEIQKLNQEHRNNKAK
ncbi:hypothetical protein CIB95_14335 [Lottiidibacillus patelloidae]|uniref:DUF2573 domain-containing protein n=1 Tax=Lottiidibacillus patelloidae TaxID=2670334 RepID=A0A263BRM6_9BACI|nr:DUF2573 family protein [Lottiidibacillus patelloidae]OZM56017.1 hypothetical protein CIB95_14335 [Lottiidibacillus patelloidae]